MDSPAEDAAGVGDFIKTPPEKNGGGVGGGGASKGEMKTMKEEPPEEWPEDFMENAYAPGADESVYRYDGH